MTSQFKREVSGRCARVNIDPQGQCLRAFVCDSGNNRVQVLSRKGAFVCKWGSEGSADGQFNEPTGVAVDDEHVFVSDGRARSLLREMNILK